MLRLALVVAAAALLAPPAAGAALSFAFDRAQARPGNLVHAYQADVDGNAVPAWSGLDGVTLYLARVNNPWRRVRLGPLEVDANGVWSIDFRVPKVRPGLFTVAFFCRPCGGTYFPSTLPGTVWTGKPGRVLKVRR